jgi:anti-anti-sigma factor
MAEVIMEGGTAEITVSGELDLLSMPTMQRLLARVAERGPERLVFDLSDVAFLDCSSARALAQAARAQGAELVIHRASQAARRVLDLTGQPLPAGASRSPTLPDGASRSRTNRVLTAGRRR